MTQQFYLQSKGALRRGNISFNKLIIFGEHVNFLLHVYKQKWAKFTPLWKSTANKRLLKYLLANVQKRDQSSSP